MLNRNILLTILILYFISFIYSNNECVWVIGYLICKHNQSSVIGSIVNIYDLDGPRNVKKKYKQKFFFIINLINLFFIIFLDDV